MTDLSDYTEITDWDRQALYESYMKFDNPCYSVTVPVYTEETYRYAKKAHRSFFICMLYVLTKAMNDTENFRMRNISGRPVILQRPNVLTPVAVGSTGFCETLIESDDDFDVFYENARRSIETVKETGRRAIIDDMAPYLIICVPWFCFTGFTPADFSTHQTNPILTFGK